MGSMWSSLMGLNQINIVYDEIVNKFFIQSVENKKSRIRLSIEKTNKITDSIELEEIGTLFNFVNREDQCKELVKAFGNMDSKRGSHTFDTFKRDLQVPLLTGLPGINVNMLSRNKLLLYTSFC